MRRQPPMCRYGRKTPGVIFPHWPPFHGLKRGKHIGQRTGVSRLVTETVVSRVKRVGMGET